MKTGFVVIYDEGDENTEQYYGFFSTAEDAEEMYKLMVGDDPQYHSAHVCQIVKEI